jgi:hypothetical protein
VLHFSWPLNPKPSNKWLQQVRVVRGVRVLPLTPLKFMPKHTFHETMGQYSCWKHEACVYLSLLLVALTPLVPNLFLQVRGVLSLALLKVCPTNTRTKSTWNPCMIFFFVNMSHPSNNHSLNQHPTSERCTLLLHWNST